MAEWLNPRWKDVYTKQKYGAGAKIDGVDIIPLRQFHDDGGNFTELARITEGVIDASGNTEIRQINYSECAPGAVKAFHVHMRQTDIWYVPPSDRMLMVLFDARAAGPEPQPTMRFILGDGESKLIVIPPGVAHGVKNLASTTGRIIYFVDRQFRDDDLSDEGRLPWDVLGADIWEMTKG